MADTVRPAVDAIARGQFAVVLDAATRENEADLVIAAEALTTEQMAFLLRHTSGIVCTPMPQERADQLDLPLMVTTNTERHGTAFTVSVDAGDGITTGVSAADRARTVRLLGDSRTRPSDLRRPGHVFPLRAHPRGVLGRAGHTEASIELARLAGIDPVMVISELIREDGAMVTGQQAVEWAEANGLAVVSTDEIVLSRRHDAVERVATIPLQTEHGDFTATLMRTQPDGLEHIVLSHGDIATDPASPVLVRVHSECATGDLFGSRRCECGKQMNDALRAITEAGAGVLVYVRGHEGRGIGLADKFRAYELQDDGMDTVDANLALGHPADARDFTPAAMVLGRLGVETVELMTNNPDKVRALRAFGLIVTARPLRVPPEPANVRYLSTKQTRLGHLLTPSAMDEHRTATTGAERL